MGAKINGRIVPLHTKLNSGDIIEVITSRSSRGPSRDWLGIATTPRARQKIRQHFRREQREDSEHSGRDLLQETLRRQGLPAQKLLSSNVFSHIVKELGYQKADDLYVALGSGRIPVRAVVNRGHAAQRQRAGGRPRGRDAAHRAQRRGAGERLVERVRHRRRGHERHRRTHGEVLQTHPRRRDRRLHLAGQGCHHPSRRVQERKALLAKNRERFTTVTWEGLGVQAFRVELQIEALDRNHLLEEIARTLSDSGVNIVGAAVQTLPDGIVRDRFVLEIGDVHQVANVIANLKPSAPSTTPTGWSRISGRRASPGPTPARRRTARPDSVSRSIPRK